jgi:predicted nucleic acid-binding protein
LSLVVDASLALAWCFEDERTPEILDVGSKVEAEGAVVPAIFHLEVANTLLQSEKRGRTSTLHMTVSLDALRSLPIETDLDDEGRAWTAILFVARSQALTSYDATYLDLALRRGLPLATQDARLRAACNAIGVTLLPVKAAS